MKNIPTDIDAGFRAYFYLNAAVAVLESDRAIYDTTGDVHAAAHGAGTAYAIVRDTALSSGQDVALVLLEAAEREMAPSEFFRLGMNGVTLTRDGIKRALGLLRNEQYGDGWRQRAVEAVRAARDTWITALNCFLRNADFATGRRRYLTSDPTA